MSLVVVGSVAFDSIKTPGGRIDDALGGSAVHFSLASQLLFPTRLVGVVGSDFPAAHRELLKKQGVDLEGLATVEGGKTFRWSGEYFDDMNHRETLSVELNVFDDFQPVLPSHYREASFVFLANGAPATQSSVLDQMKSRPFAMADTMNLWIQTSRHDLEALLRRVDGLVLNDEESFLLSDEKNLIKAGLKICDFGLRYVIIKKGEHGSLIFHDGHVIALPALPVTHLVDPTGAGDSFAGGIMGYLASVGTVNLATLKVAVTWGTVLASFCCEGFGVAKMIELSAAAARERFESYRQMIMVEI